MILKYDGTNLLWQSEDTLGTQVLMTAPVSSSIFLSKPYNLFLSVNLATGSYGVTGGGIVANTNNPSATTIPVLYDSDWSFDSTLQISVCADYGSTNSIQCTVQNLKVHYYFYSGYLSVIDFANQVTMRADYQLNEGTGTTLANSQGTFGPASLSSTPPTWTSALDGGLSFTSASQYIQLPNFIPSPSDMTVTASLAFTFYIKIDTAPSTTSNIMSYYSVPKSNIVFQLLVDSTLNLHMGLDTVQSSASSISLTLGKWAMIFVSFSFTYGGYGGANIYIDGAIANPAIATNAAWGAHGNTVFSTSDYVRIGAGFLGQLRRLQVYSPAAFRLSPSVCDSSTCGLDFGFSVPLTCLSAICTTGSYTSFGSCESCPTGCSACSDATTCTSCSSGYYYDASLKSCPSCPIHCSSCIDSTTCQSCDSGYGVYNSVCMLCPAGTYLSSDQICKKFSETLQDTLTNSQLLNSAVTQATNLISKGRAISLSAAISGKIFSQIKYLNISYSGELEVALLTWKTSFVSLGLTPDMPQSMMDKIPDRSVPFVFEKYDVPSSFLENFWENLGVIVFFTVIWILLIGGEYFISPQKRPRTSSIARKVRVMAQNFLISSLYEVYGDLVMYSIIEYRTLIFGWNLSLLSFIISVILLIIMFFSFWFQSQLLATYQKLKKQDKETSPHNENPPKLLEKFTKKHEGSQVLFKGFKDYSLAPQLFIFFTTLRDLLFSLILATMFEYPLPETVIISIMDCLMIVYLLTKRPFDSSFDAYQQMFFEIISLIVSVSVLINAVLDAGKYEAKVTRKNIGKLIIVANMIFNFVTGFFMLISIIQIVREFVKEIKEKRAKKIKALNVKNRPLNQTEQKPQITLNRNLDSSQISLKGNDLSNQTQSFETLPEKNPEISLQPPMIKSVVSQSQRRRDGYQNTSAHSHSPGIHHPPVDLIQNPRHPRSRSPIQQDHGQSQEFQELNLSQMDSFPESRVHHSSDLLQRKGKHRLRMNQKMDRQSRQTVNFILGGEFKFDEEKE